MNYIIMNLRSFGGEYDLELSQSGNKYGLRLQWRKDGDICEECKYKYVEYDEINEAIKRFTIGTVLIGKGVCNFEDKVKMIFN